MSRFKRCKPVDHVLLRHDTYVGDVGERLREDEYVLDDETQQFIARDVLIIPALERIFIEPLSNALDNVPRSVEQGVPMSAIRVTIAESGETSVWNDGAFIPNEIHPEEHIWTGSLIFGELLTSDNYDDSQERKRSGRNGYGAKLTNIFSESFHVELTDPDPEAPPDDPHLRVFRQTWRGNMKRPEEARISRAKGTRPSILVRWTPDPSIFGPRPYTRDVLSVLHKLVYEAAMVAGGAGIKVYLNGARVPVSSVRDYARLFGSHSVVEFSSADSDVALAPSSTGWDAVSFTNGVVNKDGGVHVSDWSAAIFRPLLKKINKKGRPQLTVRDIRPFFRLFVNCTLTNPRFTSQSKTELAGPRPATRVIAKQINAVMRWEVMDRIREVISAKELLSLKKTEKKKKGFQRIEGYDPANNSGGAKSSGCTLIFTEGLSAKTYAVRGIEKGFFGKKGRDWFGIFPLSGKILNVRKARTEQIAANKAITNAVNAVGLQYATDYTLAENFRKLKYGRIVMLCDADVDGIHIQGLLLNAFRFLFPTLFNREEPYVIAMETPIVRILSRPHKIFYSERAFREFLELNPESGKTRRKYHKGLGTSSNSEVVETFGERLTAYTLDDSADSSLCLAFDDKSSDRRKVWLERGPPDSDGIEAYDESGLRRMSLKDFVAHRMIHFSTYDCGRSLPCVLDGLKESQRKILYAVMLKKLHYKSQTMKVAQLAGYVAEKTSYHHGEKNLDEAIKRLANDIIGQNNIPLLFRDGQFGTRLSGGDDASAGRYIFTKLDRLTRILFPEADDRLLKRRCDDGDTVEPHFYVPIIPMLLVNGCTGIGTGWSSKVPLYNPLDLVRACKSWLKTGKEGLKEPAPWYRGFKGTIVKIGEGRYRSSGVIERKKNGTVRVTELPIGLWTDRFKEFLEGLLEDKVIKSVKNYSTPALVLFEIKEAANGLRCTLDNLKLCTTISTSNMVTFTGAGKIRKFGAVTEIIDYFCHCRYRLYERRKEWTLGGLRSRLSVCTDKLKFLGLVMEDKVAIQRVSEEEIEEGLAREGLRKRVGQAGKESYDHLLSMDLRSFTSANLERLARGKTDLELKIEEELSRTPELAWSEELDTFVSEYRKWLKAGSK